MHKIQHKYTSRYFHITFLFLFAAIVVIAKLFDLQIIQHKKIEHQIDSKISRTSLTLTGRGKILSKGNKVLAIDKPYYRLTVTAKDLQLEMGIIQEIDFTLSPKTKRFRSITQKGFVPTKKKALLKKISNLTPRLSKEPLLINLAKEYNLDFEKLIIEIKNALLNCAKGWAYLSQSQILEIYLDQYQAFSLLKTNSSNGFSCIQSSLRVYPNNEVAAHLIGHLGPITEKEFNVIRMKGHYPVLPNVYHPIKLTELERLNLHLINNYYIGKMGIEYLHNQTLRGRLSKSVHMRGVGMLKDQEFIEFDGEDIELTIDLELQKLAHSMLYQTDTQRGSIVMYDITTGETLVAVSLPSFNPNFLTPPHDNAYIREAHQQHGIFINRCFEATYPFGSIYKVITSVAALEEKIVTPDSTYYCALKHPKTKLTCLGYHSHTSVTRALEKSCNIYFYDAALELGIVKLYNWSRKFYLGRQVGCGFKSERKGIIPNPGYKRNISSEMWYPGDTCHSAIGQGYQLGTPIQAAVISGLIAKEKTRSPHFWKNARTKELSVKMSDITRDTVRKGMWKVVNANGTAKHSRSEKIIYAGKTGTADVYRKNPHAWFSGFAPFDNPRVAMAIIVENSGHGGEISAPIAKVLFEKWADKYQTK
jgi:penicillin-binding protein 2